MHRKEKKPTDACIETLAEETLLHLFSFLAPRDRVVASLVSTKWKRIAEDTKGFVFEDERYKLNEEARTQDVAIKKELFAQLNRMLKPPSSSTTISHYGQKYLRTIDPRLFNPHVSILLMGADSLLLKQKDEEELEYVCEAQALFHSHGNIVTLFSQHLVPEPIPSPTMIIFFPELATPLHVQLKALPAQLHALGVENGENKIILIANANFTVGKYISVRVQEGDSLQTTYGQIRQSLREVQLSLKRALLPFEREKEQPQPSRWRCTLS